MALIGNHSILNKSFQRTYGGTSVAISAHMNNKSSLMSTSILRSRSQLQFKKASIPSGYAPGSAVLLPKTNGELGDIPISGIATTAATALSARIAALNSISGVASVLGAANAIGLIQIAGASSGVATTTAITLVTSSMSGAVTGAASILANLGAVIPSEASSAGSASVSANLKGTGRLAGVISIGASGYLSNDDVERLAKAVWDIMIAEHATTGSTGKALADAGGAGNPWASDLTSNNDPGTFGERVQKLLTKNQFSAISD